MKFALVSNTLRSIAGGRTSTSATGSITVENTTQHTLSTGAPTVDPDHGLAIVGVVYSITGHNAEKDLVFELRIEQETTFKTPLELTPEEAADENVMSPAIYFATGLVHTIATQTLNAMGVPFTLALPAVRASFAKQPGTVPEARRLGQ